MQDSSSCSSVASAHSCEAADSHVVSSPPLFSPSKKMSGSCPAELHNGTPGVFPLCSQFTMAHTPGVFPLCAQLTMAQQMCFPLCSLSALALSVLMLFTSGFDVQLFEQWCVCVLFCGGTVPHPVALPPTFASFAACDDALNGLRVSSYPVHWHGLLLMLLYDNRDYLLGKGLRWRFHLLVFQTDLLWTKT